MAVMIRDYGVGNEKRCSGCSKTWSVWEIGIFKLFLHKGINTVYEFLCTSNVVCVHVT